MKIIFWLGPSWEVWNPDSILDGGIGGSETAAIHMATELARWGHEVVVYGQFDSHVTWPTEPSVRDHPKGIWREGARFLDYRTVTEDTCKYPLECDVFISSRCKEAVRFLKPKARLKVLWMHDIHVGDDYQDDIGRFDLIFCLSEWSRKYFLNLYAEARKDKVIVTRNGIDTRLFLREPRKQGIRFTYSSSPDRGLEQLLSFWPKIRKIAPEAELHVYYGFHTWDKMNATITNPVIRNLAEMRVAFLKEQMRLNGEHGVVDHGRVSQVELAKSFLASTLWLHPTNFKETSCITAMEAQAAGCVPVTTSLAALSETVRYGMLIKPSNTDERYEQEFLSSIRWLLEDSSVPDRVGSFPRRPELAEEGRKWALGNLSWTQVAGRWEEIFEDAMKKNEKIEGAS